MGFFNLLFGPAPKAHPPSAEKPKPPDVPKSGERFRFTRSAEMHQEIYHALKTVLSGDQRQKVEEILGRYMDGGGVTHGEIDTWIIRDLRKLRDSGGLSRVEFEAVMRLLREHS